MARETVNVANATEAAAKAGERFVTDTTRTGQWAGESAAKAGEKVATETADRIEKASKAYGAAMEATFKAVQDYNTKLVQMIQTNAEANLRLGEALMQIRSPADLVETMGRSVRERAELVSGQSREFAALGQEAARRAIEAIASNR